LYISFCRHWRY
jgi:hypothetical protein